MHGYYSQSSDRDSNRVPPPYVGVLTTSRRLSMIFAPITRHPSEELPFICSVAQYCDLNLRRQKLSVTYHYEEHGTEPKYVSVFLKICLNRC